MNNYFQLHYSPKLA